MNDKQKLSIISKSATRLLVVQALYATLLNKQSVDHVIEHCKKLIAEHDEEVSNSIINKRFNNKLIISLVENNDTINLALQKNIKAKENLEIQPVVSAIIRVAIAEMIGHSTPKAVIIAEYVAIAEDIASSGEVKLVNALISKITDSE